MNTISKILIPFNFKESALNALKYGIALSENTQDTQIKLLYIMRDESVPRSEIESQFSEIIEKYNSKYKNGDIIYQISEGEIVTQTLQAKDDFDADLILMGTKGVKGGSEINSTNTSRLIYQAECPVLAVPKSFQNFKCRNITIAIDKSEIENPGLLTILLVIARRFDAKIHVLTVYDEDDPDFLHERQNESTLTYYFQRYYYTSSNVRSSSIADSIIEYDKKQSIDMLAIIPRNHEKSHIPSEGKLTQYLIMHSGIPILTID